MPDRRPIIGLILAVTATGIMANTLLSPAIPDILDDFGVGDSGAGVLIASASLPGIVIAPIVGVLADRYGRRRVLVPCLVAFGGFGVAAMLAPTFPALIAARLGMGLGSAGLINLAVVLIGDHWSDAERTRIIGRNAAFLTICIAVFPLIGGLLTQLAGWRAALAPYGVALATALLAMKVLEPRAPDRSRTIRQQLSGVGAVARRPEIVVMLTGGAVAFVLIFGVYLSALPLHLEEQFGYDAGVRGVFLALPAASSTIVAFNLVGAADRAKADATRTSLKTIAGAMDLYKTTYNEYPRDMRSLLNHNMVTTNTDGWDR
ncbi:MAG: MFS transporter, partial [Actinomycetota bacterium]